MKNINIHLLIVLFLVLAINRSMAQQDPNYTFYRFNMNLINPAFAGAGETMDFGLTLRSQWAGVEGAPETQSFLFGTPVGSNVGLGASVLNDKTFVENQTFFAVDFSYKVKLNESLDLFLGLKGSFTSYDVNTSGLRTYGIHADPSLIDIDGRFTPNVGAGIYLKNDKYFVSLSAPKILTPDRLEQNDGEARLGVDKVHLYLVGGYDFSLSDALILKSSSMIRYVDSSPISVDLTGILEFNQQFGLGAGYRFNESLSGLFMFRKNWFEIGYAYEMALESKVRNIDNGTHEILLNIKL